MKSFIIGAGAIGIVLLFLTGMWELLDLAVEVFGHASVDAVVGIILAAAAFIALSCVVGDMLRGKI